MHCIKCASQRATVDGSHTEREDNEDNTNSSRGKSANNDAQDVAEDAESVSSPKGADSPVNDDSSNGTESPSSTGATSIIIFPITVLLYHAFFCQHTVNPYFLATRD